MFGYVKQLFHFPSSVAVVIYMGKRVDTAQFDKLCL